jgi:hypothetical protein
VLRSPRLLFVPILAGPLLLTGCSTHPLPEDMIDLPINEIVHQIQCEAARTVRARYEEAGFPAFETAYATANDFISTQGEDLKEQEGILASFSDFGTTSRELEDARASIRLQLLQVSEEAARVVSQNNSSKEALKGAVLDRLEQEKDQLTAQLAAVKTAQMALDKKEKLEKSLKAARGKLGKGGSLADFKEFVLNTAVFEFEFDAQEDNNATSNGTITWPIALGTIKLAYDVGDKKQRLNERTVKVVSTFAELIVEKDQNCGDVAVAVDERFPRRYPITGEIGLDEVISDYLIVAGRKGRKFSTTDGKSYFNAITFTTTVNGGLNPSISLTKRMGQLVDADVDLAVIRKDVHKVTIYLKPPGSPAKPAATQEIIIKQMPTVRTRTRIVRQQPTG